MCVEPYHSLGDGRCPQITLAMTNRFSIPHCIALDVMGVIFSAADDVAELLIPFVLERGGTTDCDQIRSAYHKASLGHLDADSFWVSVGLTSACEDEYLARHALTPGALSFLERAKSASLPVWCLSNDVARWSTKLRERFALNELLVGAVISGEVGVRKPAAEIYSILLQRSGYAAHEVLFIDDRQTNVDAAAALGIRALRFGGEMDFVRLSTMQRS